ncbi:MAG: PaaI family thioesterase, partial [Armatimonadetes bacterium]|nr:PaaI family thioesterase [Anaerolineae bacterium]
MTENTSLRTQTFTWEDPMIGAQAARTLTGLEYMTKLMRGELPAAPIAILMNMLAAEVEFGRIIFSAQPAEYHYNPLGIVHGGFAATLLDSALGCAVHSTLPMGVGFSTLALQVNYVRAITSATGIVYCEGKVIHGGRRIATAEARLTDGDGKLYAHGTTTC